MNPRDLVSHTVHGPGKLLGTAVSDPAWAVVRFNRPLFASSQTLTVLKSELTLLEEAPEQTELEKLASQLLF